MIKEISYKDSQLLDDPIYIDVRTPDEFDEDHIPGAINIPILDNEQRKIVGTIYKQIGQEEARIKGVELVLPELTEKIKKILSCRKDGQLVIYCWRGGMRSRSVSEMLDLLGLEVYKLKDGYKEYRYLVVDYFESEETVFPELYVLYGLTGVGKTEIIDNLLKMKVNCLDLEGYANHRGSVFGSVGLGEQPSQKMFESRLYRELSKIDINEPVIVEGESKKIGKIFIPQRFFNHLTSSKKILVYDTLESRTERIIKEYTSFNQRTEEELISSVRYLARRIGKKKTEEMVEKIIEKKYKDVVKVLLLDYYDPLYKHPSGPSTEYFGSVSSTDTLKAAEEVKELIS